MANYKLINGVLHKLVYSPYRRDPRTGKIYYPKHSKVFRFWTPVERSA